jgi:hypothetical protein
LITLSILIGSCTRSKEKFDKKNLIPEKELVSLLIDIHITDGLLSNPKINSDYSNLDSIATYYQVIEKHGYTKEIMDKTMRYYWFNDPKKLNKIYDKVLGTLSEMEVREEKEFNLEQARVSNLWRGKDFFAAPTVSHNDSTKFDLALTKSGFYTLTFSSIVYPDDQGVNAKPFVYTVSPDSIETGKKHYLKSLNYLKDGLPHTYSLTVTVPRDRTSRMRGRLFNFENNPALIVNHFKIDNISVTYGLGAI